YDAADRAGQLLTALFDASLAIDDRRLPELFCGFARDVQQRPVPYPVACKPQAWAAGSVFLLLQSTLGLSVDGWERRIRIQSRPWPGWLQRLDIRGLRIGEAQVDLTLARAGDDGVKLVHRKGDADVVVERSPLGNNRSMRRRGR